MALNLSFLTTNYMIAKEIIYKSFLPPALATFNGITYVVPGWHAVPEGTTLKEVQEHWEKDVPTGVSEINPTHEISETVISTRTGEEYTVNFSGRYWSCTCIGFNCRGRCKHVEAIKLKYSK